MLLIYLMILALVLNCPANSLKDDVLQVERAAEVILEHRELSFRLETKSRFRGIVCGECGCSLLDSITGRRYY